MVGISIINMQRGPDRYRGSLLFDAWPSLATQSAWDATHARILMSYGKEQLGSDRRQASRLACVLDPASELDGRSPVPTSLACVRYRLAAADGVGANLSECCAGLAEPAHFFTAIPTYGEVDHPDEIDATWMKERLRNDLNDRGALGSDGILCAVIEAEYQMRSGRWRFHLHGVASGGKLRAVRALSALPAYRTTKRLPGGAKPPVTHRVKTSIRSLYDLPKPITYCLKQWNARWEDAEGERGRRRRMPRMVIPAMLFWQDRWSLSDITLLMGLRPGRDGFVINGGTRMTRVNRKTKHQT